MPNLAEKRQLQDEAHQTEQAMMVLQDMIPEVLEEAGPGVRERFDNAMLNIAVHRILAVEGPERTATILMRLADVVLEQGGRRCTEPVELMQLDG